MIRQSLNEVIIVAINKEQDHLLASLNYYVGARGISGSVRNTRCILLYSPFNRPYMTIAKPYIERPFRYR